MTHLSQALERRTPDYFSSFVKIFSRKKIDPLSETILKIHRLQSIEELVEETSRALKNIISYKLFAFVIMEEKGLRIWSDPLLSSQRLTSMIAEDFPDAEINKVTYIKGHDKKVIRTFFHKPESVTSKIIETQNTKACLYLIHGATIFSGREKSAELVIQAFENTLRQILHVRQLEIASSTDHLTGCFNRRALKTTLERTMKISERHRRELSVMMLDVDHFKSINDTYGHLFGDHVLKSIADCIRKTVRKSDFTARYGGEEFVVILPETPVKGAIEIANQLKNKISNISFTTEDKQNVKVTASFGVASMKNNTTVNSFLEEADTMLYQAKNTGRNRVMAACF